MTARTGPAFAGVADSIQAPAKAWLNLFAHRISLKPWPFVAALLVSLVVAWLAVGVQTIGAARAKPARVLQAG